MPASPYRRFSRALHRITLLYEVTTDAYQLLYDSGREKLKLDRAQTHEMRLAGRRVRRPLSLLTFQARDVYPGLLRSTLLIRLVATYEAFISEELRSTATRTRDLIAKDARIELTQEHLVALMDSGDLDKYLLDRTLRSLSTSGFKEVVKFLKRINISVAPSGISVKELEEIHDRRHLFVHRAGLADETYCKAHPSIGVVPDERVVVDEEYFLSATALLDRSAAHIQSQLIAAYPPTDWRYLKASQQYSSALSFLSLYRGRLGPGYLFDLEETLSDGLTKLGDVVVWVGYRERQFKLLIGGSPAQAEMYSLSFT